MRTVVSHRVVDSSDLPVVTVGTDGTAVIRFIDDDDAPELVGSVTLLGRWLDAALHDLSLAAAAVEDAEERRLLETEFSDCAGSELRSDVA